MPTRYPTVAHRPSARSRKSLAVEYRKALPHALPCLISQKNRSAPTQRQDEQQAKTLPTSNLPCARTQQTLRRRRDRSPSWTYCTAPTLLAVHPKTLMTAPTTSISCFPSTPILPLPEVPQVCCGPDGATQVQEVRKTERVLVVAPEQPEVLLGEVLSPQHTAAQAREGKGNRTNRWPKPKTQHAQHGDTERKRMGAAEGRSQAQGRTSQTWSTYVCKRWVEEGRSQAQERTSQTWSAYVCERWVEEWAAGEVATPRHAHEARSIALHPSINPSTIAGCVRGAATRMGRPRVATSRQGKRNEQIQVHKTHTTI